MYNLKNKQVIKKLCFLSLLIFNNGLLSCEKVQVEEEVLSATSAATIAEANNDYFAKNCAYFDTRARSLDSEHYVKEVLLLDFKTGGSFSRISETANIHDVFYADNGQGNDLKADDGVYTSIKSFAHDAVVPYIASQPVRSGMSQPIVNSAFEHIKELNKYSKSYAFRSIKSLHPTKQGETDPDSINYNLVEITCSIEFGVNGCIANQIGLCNNCCFTIYNCTSITFGF